MSVQLSCWATSFNSLKMHMLQLFAWYLSVVDSALEVFCSFTLLTSLRAFWSCLVCFTFVCLGILLYNTSFHSVCCFIALHEHRRVIYSNQINDEQAISLTFSIGWHPAHKKYYSHRFSSRTNRGRKPRGNWLTQYVIMCASFCCLLLCYAVYNKRQESFLVVS